MVNMWLNVRQAYLNATSGWNPKENREDGDDIKQLVELQLLDILEANSLIPTMMQSEMLSLAVFLLSLLPPGKYSFLSQNNSVTEKYYRKVF